MKTSNNTILITGGSAGIGFEIAKLFSKDNTVIITGRNEERLREATAKLSPLAGEAGKVKAIVGDVSDAADVNRLVETLYREFPALNIVINNAGSSSSPYSLAEDGANAYEKAEKEMLTNYLAVIRLNEKLLPLLRKQEEAAIVSVSSIVSIVPNHRLPGYAASKAALHSYTQSLRHALASTSVKVLELRPPLVDTEFSAEIGGKNGISPSVVAEQLRNGLEKNIEDVRVGRTEDIYRLYLTSPEQAFQALNPQPQNV